MDSDKLTKADLLDMIRELASSSAKSVASPASRPPIIKIAEPSRFSGQRDIAFIDSWFLTMERYLNHYQVDPVNWVSTAIHFLDARAILWWNRLEKLPSKPLTWADFKQQINTEFKPIFAHVTARDRFAVLKQGTSSVQDYVHALQDILLEATDISDAEAIDHFVRHLKPQLYAKVRGTRPATLEAAFKVAFDEEICHLPPGTVPSSGSLPMPSASHIVDDSMDLSVAFNNLYCEWCRRKGHVIDDCRTKASAIDKFIKDHLQKNNQNTSRFVKRNNYNSNNNNWKRRSNNHNQRNNDNRNNQLLNMLLDKLSLDDTSSSSVNKTDDLIDLSSGRDEDDFSAYFPASSSESVNVLSDVKFVLNVSSNLSSKLPLYQAMIGGSHFKVLIDSGASANYVHPKLLHYAKSKTMVKNQSVETADGQQTGIDTIVNLDMYLGDGYSFKHNLNAFVFDSKFDIILGNAWLKHVKPSPDWFSNTWTITYKNGVDTTVLNPIKHKQVSTVNTSTDISNQISTSTPSTSDNDATLISNSIASESPAPPQSTFFDLNDLNAVDLADSLLLYLLKNQILECFVINFAGADSDNTSVTPIYPPTIDNLHELHNVEVANASTGEQWKREFEKLFPYAFKDEITELPPHRNTRDIIVTNPTNAAPISVPPYRMSPLELKELRRQLNDLEKKGLIVPTASPWGAPILFVRKANKELRMVCDFRALNRITISQKIPIPRIDECLDLLHNATHFSQIDLTGAFNQTRLSDADSHRATISHRFGQHRWLVTPFGLRNSGPYFQSQMNFVLRDCTDFAVCYLDDILIFSQDESTHKEHVKMVLSKLDEAKFVINKKKSHFNIQELTFLGFDITKHGVLPSKKKVAAVQNWPVPKNVQQVRQFCGLAQHYKRFIPNYAGIASCLTDITSGSGSKTRPIVWTPECQKSFDLLKSLLCSAPLLSTPDMDKPFRIECDSSDFAVGAVLLQQDKDLNWKPLAYESKKLSQAERNYPAQERELLAILVALRTWRCFIDGKNYVVYTDHKPLTHLQKQQKVTPRLVRWVSELDLFNPVIEYKKGADNIVPDLLSRRDGPDCTSAPTSIQPKYLYSLSNNNTTKSARTLDTTDDPIQNWPKFYIRPESEWPASLKAVLTKHQNQFQVTDGVIYKIRRKPNSDDSNDITKLKYIPFAKRADLVDDFHSGFGHSGQANVYHYMKDRVWWPNMQSDINLWLSRCPQCQLPKRSKKSTHHAPMKPLNIPPPFARWHLDFIGELPVTKNQNK